MALKEGNIETEQTVVQPDSPVRVVIVHHQQVETSVLVDSRQLVGCRSVFSLVHLGCDNLGRVVLCNIVI